MGHNTVSDFSTVSISLWSEFHRCAIPLQMPFHRFAFPANQSAIPPIFHSSKNFTLTLLQQSPMKGDAGEYIHLLKCSLLAEVKAQCGKDEDYNNDLIKSITKFWDMFNSGLTEESIQCSVCKNVTKQQIPFEELILYFDKSHHDDNKKHNSCTLGELFTSYFTTNDDNLERECHTCNERTQSTVWNFICCYPEVLCIVLCCNIFKDNTSSRILSSVDFPVENFKPNEHFGIHEGTDDTTYNLIALVNHHPRPNNQGHYTAICR